MHIDDERLQRYVDGELGAADRGDLEAHWRSCAACRERLAELRTEEADIAELLKSLDGPALSLSADHVIAAARGAERGARASEGRSKQVHRGLRRWAASIVLLFGLAAGAWAAPGSPLPRWWRSLRAWPQSEAPASPSPDLAGLSFSSDRALEIDVVDPPAGLVLRIGVGSRPDVSVRVPRGAAGFTTAEGQLTIRPHETGLVIDVNLPTDARSVVLRVEGRVLFEAREGRISSEATPDGEGVYILRPDQ
ncbi:MAG: zf-HC2 domain-containing protein [Gemmatimonadota bacterium]